jgi:hypothetical protein
MGGGREGKGRGERDGREGRRGTRAFETTIFSLSYVVAGKTNSLVVSRGSRTL